MKPRLRQIANLWTVMGYPTRKQEWTLDRKLAAIRSAGFDGVCWAPSEELYEGCKRHGLMFVGGMAPRSKGAFPELLDELRRFGALHVNVQLGTDDVETPEALDLTLRLMEQAGAMGLLPAIETHRGTCTETPEKMYALADAYEQATGEGLRISCDFSHFAVVKHLVADDFVERLLVRPELIQLAQQFHLRPFNGHHVQVPITHQGGELTPEVLAWLPFAESLLRCWIEGNADSGREIFVCPELGPVEGGYALSTFPDVWEDAKRLRGVIEELWDRVAS